MIVQNFINIISHAQPNHNNKSYKFMQWTHDNEYITIAKKQNLVIIYGMEYGNKMYIRGALNSEIIVDFDTDVQITFELKNNNFQLPAECILASISYPQTNWHYDSNIPIRVIILHDKDMPFIAIVFSINDLWNTIDQFEISNNEIIVKIQLTENEEIYNFFENITSHITHITELTNKINR